MNFCNNCGHSPLEYKQPEGDNRVRYICSNCEVVHYQNPKIVCGCLVFYEGKILLGKRGIEPRMGKWNFPAGFMENHETVKEGAAREVWEEVRAKVEIERLHTVYNILHVNQVYFLFLAKLTEPIFGAAEETSDVRLFAMDEIPWDDLAFHSNVFALEQYIKDPSYKGVHHGDNRAYMNDIK
ncbi:NUDIX hydrolase [Aureispira sp. CCB-QB1]|uniref:NUDIX hydrolase n=1 Tax=Aureispira sp. CCB-QB1 TaxID=1313421 RepID=UPI000697CF56|nr:NUDIX hydrolase [Aureispira sp. CCB-QB1]